MDMIQGFLLGVIATTSFTVAGFFLKFWRETRDMFFLAFAAAFAIEGINRISVLLLEHPNEGSPAIYVVRMFAFLLILVAIIHKNRRRR